MPFRRVFQVSSPPLALQPLCRPGLLRQLAVDLQPAAGVVRREVLLVTSMMNSSLLEAVGFQQLAEFVVAWRFSLREQGTWPVETMMYCWCWL